MPALQKGSLSKDGKRFRFTNEHGKQESITIARFANRREAETRLRTRLVQVMNYAMDAKYVTENVAAKFTLNAPDSPEKQIFGSFADVRSLASACKDRRDQALILFLGATGMRPEEAFALERSDIDRAAGT